MRQGIHEINFRPSGNIQHLKRYCFSDRLYSLCVYNVSNELVARANRRLTLVFRKDEQIGSTTTDNLILSNALLLLPFYQNKIIEPARWSRGLRAASGEGGLPSSNLRTFRIFPVSYSQIYRLN